MNIRNSGIYFTDLSDHETLLEKKIFVTYKPNGTCFIKYRKIASINVRY